MHNEKAGAAARLKRRVADIYLLHQQVHPSPPAFGPPFLAQANTARTHSPAVRNNMKKFRAQPYIFRGRPAARLAVAHIALKLRFIPAAALHSRPVGGCYQILANGVR